MKVLLRFLLMVVLVSYLFVSFFFLRSYAAEDKCRDLQVEITDSAVLHYISPADVYNYIEDFEMDPCGKPLGGIDTEKMERTLMSNGVLGSVECYKKVGGTMYLSVSIYIVTFISFFLSSTNDLILKFQRNRIVHRPTGFTEYLFINQHQVIQFRFKILYRA